VIPEANEKPFVQAEGGYELKEEEGQIQVPSERS
jgi:hypothetical protein